MAEPASLSNGVPPNADEQQDKLQQLKSISGIVNERLTLELLQRFDWSVETALNHYFGNIEDYTERAHLESPVVDEIPINSGSVSSSGLRQRIPAVVQTSPAGPISPSTDARTGNGLGLIQSIINKLYNTFFVPPGTEYKDPDVAFSAFLESYKKTTTGSPPELFAGSYTRCLDRAKRDLLFVLVYLHAPEHDGALQFCSSVLNEPEFWQFLSDRNCLMWAGSVYHPETFRAADAMMVTAYPSLSLVCLKNGRMQVAHHLSADAACSHDCHRVIGELTMAIDLHGAQLIVERTERQERELNRRIREEQDRAYQESLRRDQERERQRREEEDQQRRALAEQEEQLRKQKELVLKQEEERSRKLKNVVLMKEELKRTLPDEPQPGPGIEIAKIVFRLPDGSRSERKFLATDTIEQLYHYASTLELHIDGYEFTIVSNFPRKRYEDRTQTLKDAGLYPTGMLVVEEVIAE